MKVVSLDQLNACLETVDESWVAQTRLGKEMLDMVHDVINSICVYELELNGRTEAATWIKDSDDIFMCSHCLYETMFDSANCPKCGSIMYNSPKTIDPLKGMDE